VAAAETIRRAAMDLTINGAADFKKSMGEINRQLKQSQSELNKATAAYGKNERNVETLTAQKNHLNNAITLNRQEQERLNEELARATEKYGENSREVQVLQTKLTNAEAKGIALTRQLNETTAALEEQERALRGLPWTELGQKLEATGAKMQAAGKKMQDVGKTMSLALTAPLMAIGVQAVRVGADFENSMGTVQARTGMAADEVEKLGREFRTMAASGNYGTFTARQIAAAYANIAIHGQDATHATEVMRTAMVLATGTVKDLGSVAAFLSDYLLKTGKDVSDLESLINIFAATNRKTGISLSTLQNYLFRANVTLQATNISGAEASAMFGRLYQAGIKGAQAYSGVENALRSLLQPTEDQIAALYRLGVAREDENGQLRDGIPFLMDVAYALSELEGAQLSYYNQLLGSTAMGSAFLGGMVDIKGTLPETIAGLYEAANAAEGTGVAFEMAAIQQEGLTASAARVRASLEEIKLQIADALMPHIQRLTDFVGGLVQRFASLDEGTQRTVLKIAGIAAAIGPVLIIGGKLVTTAGKITSSFGALSTAIGAAGGAKAYFAAKFPLLTKAAGAYQAANVKLIATMRGTTAATTASGVAATKSAKAFTLKGVAMKAFVKTSGTVTGALAAVKAAFIKLKTVMLANPIGLIVAGVAALAGGIAYLIVRLNRVSEAYREMADETARLTERQQELKNASATAAAQFQQQITGLQNQAEYYRSLADSIAYLSSKQNLSAGEMETLRHKIEELNRGVPGLTLAYDEQTGALNLTTEALQAYLRAAEKRAALDAQLTERSRLEREFIDLQAEAMAVAEQREALEEKLNDGTNRRRADRRALEDAIRDLITAEENYKAAIEANVQMQDAVAESVEAYAAALVYLEKAHHDAAEAVAELTAEMEEQARAAEELEQAQTKALDKMNRSFENYQRIASNAFSTVSENAAISVQNLTANLQENARAVEEWSTNIAILTERGVDQGLIQQLRDAGPAAAATVRELVDASDEELDALNDAFENSTRVAVESMKREFDPAGVMESAEKLINSVANTILENQGMEDALVSQITSAFESLDNTISSIGFDSAGTNAVEGFTNGIDSMQDEVRNAGESTGENLLNSLNRELESQSPSRATQRIGVFAGEGLIRGVADIQPRVTDTARTLARAFINAIADKINHSHDIDNATRRQVEDMRRVADMAVMNAHFDSIGIEMANGVARGIQSGDSIVSNAGRNMINNALAAMRAAAAISSPSRRTTEMGMQLGDGVIIGLLSKENQLVEACKRITERVIDSLYIDPSEFIFSTNDILQSVNNALPTMQNYAKRVTGQQYATATTGPPISIKVDMTGGHYSIREDADISKIAKEVTREISREVGYAGRIGGMVFQP